MLPRQQLETSYVTINTQVKPLDNAKVRQALNMAINKDRIVRCSIVRNPRSRLRHYTQRAVLQVAACFRKEPAGFPRQPLTVNSRVCPRRTRARSARLRVSIGRSLPLSG